jgi:O-antigen chain-terminating methyltransferase
MEEDMQLPTEIEISSHRAGIGWLIVAYKKLVRLLIAPYLRNVFEKEHQFLDDMGKMINNRLVRENDELAKRIDSIAILLNQKYEGLRNRLETLRYRFEDYIDNKTLNKTPVIDDEDYLEFVKRFRGNIEDIKKKRKAYLPIFNKLASSDYILDIGCGRGEFLEILRENNIKAKGIDTNSAMVSHCKRNGLDVEKADAIDYLLSIKDDSVGGIAAYHFIEHISPMGLIRFMRLCCKKLKPGGYVVFETPNPTSLGIFTGSFYAEPTHIRPVHPDLIKYVLEAAGFDMIDIWFLNEHGDKLSLSNLPVDKDIEFINENFKKLNSLLYGALDYAIIAERIK